MLAWTVGGCGLATLSHDALLGPVSPAGRLHEVTIGRDFRVTSSGPVADSSQEPRLRPYPADLIRRLGSPGSFRALFQGFEAFASGMSLVVDRRRQGGAFRKPANMPVEGATLQEVFEHLGPPDVWICGEETAVAYYRSRSVRDLSLNLGIPPVVAGLIPVPGVASLAFRLTSVEEDVTGIVLFFDGRDRLQGFAVRDTRAEP